MSLERSGPQEADEQVLSEQEQNGYLTGQGGQTGGDEADLMLDVPMLKVEELDLEVQDLSARISLRAELADLVKVNVGVDAYLDKVKLQIKGVEAQARLTVKLERVLGTLDRALEAIDRNPQALRAAFRGQSGEDAGTGQAAEASAEATAPRSGGIDATGPAWSKAYELGVDLSIVKGTGSGGRILIRDVKEAARGPAGSV